MKYVAFLSYSRADEVFAAQLQKQLEQYVVPQAVRFDAEIGRRKPLAPIFRDKVDLVQSGSLPDRIQAAIASSKYLIVICSPKSRRSPWVNKEVDEFVDRNGSANVILIAHAGTPTALSQGKSLTEECLPLRFVDTQGRLVGDVPLWVDMTDTKTNRNSFLSIVCALLEFRSLDVLIRRDANEERKKKLFLGGAIAASILVVLGFVFALNAERQSGMADKAAVALADARIEAYAGRPMQAKAILREAYQNGARGEVERALGLLASWEVGSTTAAPVRSQPYLTSVNEQATLQLPNGKAARLTRPVHRLISDPRISFVAIHTTDGFLQSYSLDDGQLLAEANIGPDKANVPTPVIVNDSGTMIVTSNSFAATVKDNASWLHVIRADGARIMNIDTALPELDGVENLEYFHRATAPLDLAQCRYLAFARPAVTNEIAYYGVSDRSDPADFVFYEIVAKGLELLSGSPDSQAFALGAIGKPDESVPIPEGTAQNNLDTLWGCAPSQDLRAGDLQDNVLKLEGEGDLEPTNWVESPPIGPEQAPYLGESVCANGGCWVNMVGTEGAPTGARLPLGRIQSASVIDTLDFFPTIGWSQLRDLFGASIDTTKALSGLLTHGQMGHEDFYCKPSNGPMKCIINGFIAGQDFDAKPVVTKDFIVSYGALQTNGWNQKDQFPKALSVIRLEDFEVAFLNHPDTISAPLLSVSEDGRKIAALLDKGKVVEFALNWPSINLVTEYNLATLSAFAFPYHAETIQPNDPIYLSYTKADDLFIVKRDGSMSLSKGSTILWQGRYAGIGLIRAAHIMPDYQTVLLDGERGYRLIDTRTGIPASGRFLVAEAASGESMMPVFEGNSIRLDTYVRRGRQ